MATFRSQQLEQLAKQLPVANQQIATGLQEARKTQLQQAVKQAAPGASAQQLGAQSQQAAGQIQMGAAEQAQNQQQLAGQMGLQQQGRAQRQKAFDNAIQLNAVQQNLGDKLDRLGRDAKKKMLDDNLVFKMDQANQAMFNNTQLLDYAKLNAKSDEDFANKVQQIDQAYDRKLQMLQSAQNRLEQIAKQGYYSNNQRLDQNSKMKIAQQAQAIQAKIREEQAKKAAQMQKSQAIGTLAGGVIGAVVGGPVGASVGAAAGGAAGTYVGSK